MPRIHIIGAGAIGGVLAARLSLAGQDVCAVDNDREHVDAIKNHGLRVEGAYTAVARMPVVHIDDLREPLGLVVLAVKTAAVAPVLSKIARLLLPNSRVITLQNGLIAHEVAKRIGPGSVFPGSVAYAGHLVAPGLIQHGVDGDMAIGAYASEYTLAADEVVRALEAFGQVELAANIWGRIWGKTALAVLLAATAVDGRPTHEVFASRRARRVLHRLVAETVAIAAAEGIELEPVKGIDLSKVTLQSNSDDPDVDRQFEHLVEVAKSGLPHKTHSGVYYNLRVKRQTTESTEILAPIIELSVRHGADPRALKNLLTTLVRLEGDPMRMSPALLEAVA
jgi:2-dehydropantoate 2-reductase